MCVCLESYKTTLSLINFSTVIIALLLQIPYFKNSLFLMFTIDHFTLIGIVNWPLNGSEAGVDLVLIQTSLLLL